MYSALILSIIIIIVIVIIIKIITAYVIDNYLTQYVIIYRNYSNLICWFIPKVLSYSYNCLFVQCIGFP